MIHNTAIVSEDSVLGMHHRIYQYASVVRGCKIATNVSVGPYALLDGVTVGHGSTIGSHCALFPGTVIEEECFIGPHVTICNDDWPRTHKEGWDIHAFRLLPCVLVKIGASIGAGAVIRPGVTIGYNAMIAAGSTVTRDVPPEHLWINGECVPIDEDDRITTRIRHA